MSFYALESFFLGGLWIFKVLLTLLLLCVGAGSSCSIYLETWLWGSCRLIRRVLPRFMGLVCGVQSEDFVVWGLSRYCDY